MSLYRSDEIWWHYGNRPEKRIDDGNGDLPLSENYPADTLSLFTEQADSRFQAWKRMAVRALGSGTVDSRTNQNRRVLLH